MHQPQGDECQIASGPSEETENNRKEKNIQQLHLMLEQLRQAVERQNWNDLANVIGLDEIFINGHPQSRTELVAQLTRISAPLCDFDLFLGEVLKNQVAAEKATISARMQVVWSRQEDWSDHHMDLTIHAGFKMGNHSLECSYLLVDHEPVVKKGSSKPAPGVAKPVTGVEQTPPLHPALQQQITQATDDYFAKPTAAEPEARHSEDKGKGTSGKKRLVYMPVLMDIDLIRELQ
ncbi:MAG: hypothetical protein HQL75_13265 [Magnetococcales bacterium]|nr:hypothetical protein [Magnetococcales bacterium]